MEERFNRQCVFGGPIVDRKTGETYGKSDIVDLMNLLNDINDDNRLSDNFQTALAALIEHHGADALTSLAAVMRHYNIKIDSNGCGAVREGAEATHHLFIWEGDEVLEHKWCKEKDIVEITANDIKPEK